MGQLQMSARSLRALQESAGFSSWHGRLLTLRTLRAGLAGSEGIETAHLAEAIQYRPRRQT